MLHIVLIWVRQERADERIHNTVKEFPLPDTLAQKKKKTHAAVLNDTAILHIRIQITKIAHWKKLNTINPHVPVQIQ